MDRKLGGPGFDTSVQLYYHFYIVASTYLNIGFRISYACAVKCWQSIMHQRTRHANRVSNQPISIANQALDTAIAVDQKMYW